MVAVMAEPRRRKPREQSGNHTRPSSAYYVPEQANGINTLASLILKFVRSVRRMKHSEGKSITQICEVYPNINRERIEQIAFYKVLWKLDIDQRQISLIVDVYEIGAEAMLEIGDQLGLVLTRSERKNIIEWESRYKTWWEDGTYGSVD